MRRRLIDIVVVGSLLMTFFGIARAAETQFVEYPAKNGAGKGQRVVLLAGDEEYRSEEGLPMLGKILSQRHGMNCTVLFSMGDDGTINPDNQKSLSHPEKLDQADAIVMLLRFRKWDENACKHFEAAIKRGVPVIGLRTSTHAFSGVGGSFSDLNSFGKDVLGERWVSHWGRHKSEATLGLFEPGNKDDSILRGIADKEIFGDSDVYEAYPPADAKILVRGAVLKGMQPTDTFADYKKKRSTDKAEQGVNDPMMPVAWTRQHKQADGKTNRIFCTTLGAATDLQNEALRRLVVNAVYWGLELDVPAKADVNYVDPFKPSPYGFKGYRKGVKPSDLVLGKTGEPSAAVEQKSEPKAEPKKEQARKNDDKQKATEQKPAISLSTAPKGPRAALPPSTLPLNFVQRERVAIVGGAMAERFNLFGHFEARLHQQFKDRELVVRNFARPADEVALRQRPSDYTKIDDPLTAFAPDTFLCFFGFNESFAGPAGVEQFKTDYKKFLDEMAKRYPRGEDGSAPRFVLVTPAAFERPLRGNQPFNRDPLGSASTGNDATVAQERTPQRVAVKQSNSPLSEDLLPSGETENAQLKLYAAAVGDVATERGLAVVDLFAPTMAIFNEQPGLQFTINGCHQNDAGDRAIAEKLLTAMIGIPMIRKPEGLFPASAELIAAVNDKSWVHLQDYRMLNGWYVYGGRRTWDTETFPREYIKIRRMADVRDQRIWNIAQGKPVPSQINDAETGELIVPNTRFGLVQKSEAEGPRILAPDAAIKTFTVPEGFEVKLFASEREFPQLAKPCQLSFDNKGRLWAACMPTYPQWLPGDGRPSDRLLIFEDTNHDGQADVCKPFYDKLHCPTGFEFFNGGVLVVDQPRLIWLKDTDGDDKADVVVHLLDGWASDDTHHTIGAFESSHAGILHMLEGVAMSTTVETPWGPFRNLGSSGAYRLDPRTLKITHFNTPGYGNPWCYVFNPWGQGFCGDGTGGTQHWDSPLSGAQFRGRRGLNPVFNNEGMRPVVGTEFLYSRQFPDDVQGQFIYACVINMNGLTRFTISDDGAGFKGARLKKNDADGKLVPDDFLTSTDKHFRPVDPQIGPDGALWFGDWANPLIGHMQYSQRDPNRDHKHGRIYRMIYTKKPLLTPVTQHGRSVGELLAQLSDPEPRTRARARNELHARPKVEVLGALPSWLAAVDGAKEARSESERDRLVVEALWLQQNFHSIDDALLKRAASLKTPEARAAALHVIADEFEFMQSEMTQPTSRTIALRNADWARSLLQNAVTDEHPRVRLEAVRALSFYPRLESIEIAHRVTALPMDGWLSYTLQHTVGALQPLWEPALKTGELAKLSPAAAKYVTDYGIASAPGAKAQKNIDTLLSQKAKAQDKDKAMTEFLSLKGNADSGKAVFRRTCINCHRVFDEGFEYGPDMKGVATRLKAHELVESIIDPNKKVDPKYQSTVIVTDSGKVYSGLIAKEDAKTVTMKVAAVGKSVQTIDIAKDEIEERQVLKQSSMPEALANSLSPLDFLDLVEFLKTLK